jgi:LmbE family N-acetylglucosaminyl deacetylase
MDPMAPLLGRTLVLVAHPDDESITCGALLQRMRQPLVVFATDGGPQDEYFWGKYSSRDNYVALRRREAEAALQAVGVREMHWLADAEGRLFTDQHLFRHLPDAMESLRRFVAGQKPEAILTLAYEGGHPDHDSCNFLGRHVAEEFRLPVWEAPLYFRRGGDNVLLQEFHSKNGTEIEYTPTPEEFRRKLAMARAYESQKLTVTMFEKNEREKFRPMANYDYSRPPHDGQLNYEAWQWPIKGQEVADSFQKFLHSHQRAGSRR